MLEAKDYFLTAQRNDFIVPRIKPVLVDAVRTLANNDRIPLVDVQDEVPVDDRTYFIDYCHPIEPGNALLADRINSILAQTN